MRLVLRWMGDIKTNTTDETGHLDLGMDVLHGLFGASSLMGFTNGPISSGYRAALGSCDRLATLFWP